MAKRHPATRSRGPGATDSDYELVYRIRNGDPAAFHGLVEQYSQYLYGLAVHLLAPGPDAEDAVQETFAGAFRGLTRFEGRSSLKTWLTRILVRQVARCRRSAGRRKAVIGAGLTLADDAAAVPAGTRAVEVQMDVQAAVASLPDAHREVIVLREFKGLSYDEMADVLGVPRGTVESRLFRARQQLRDLLREYLSYEPESRRL